MHLSLVIFLVSCVLASYTDLRWRRVPNAITFVAAFGVVAATIPSGPVPLAWSVVALLATIVAGSFVFGFGLLGGGDIKLLAVGAAAVGFPGFLSILLYVACAGGLLAALYALREGRLHAVFRTVITSAISRSRVVPAAGSQRIPYALAITLGSLFYTASESIAPWFRLAH